jgi:hypothetical protein
MQLPSTRRRGKLFFNDWPKQRRIDVACEKMRMVSGHFLYVLEIQANNYISRH